MLKPHFAACLISASLMVLDTGVAFGQAFPNKPIRIVAGNVGGSGDFAARIIAQGLTSSLGWPVIVENRSSTAIAVEIVAKAPPDGYVLMLAGSSYWIVPLLEEARYDPVKDFSPISLASRTPGFLVVHPSLPVKSVRDLIALAKAKPGELNYSSSSFGSQPHLAAELFNAMAGVNIVGVQYKGTAPALIDLIGGQVQLSFVDATSVVLYIKSGRLKALAVTTAQPTALFPNLPTVAASGLPGYESTVKSSVLAPARIPAALIGQLNQEIVRVLSRADVKEKFFSIGAEAVGSSPEQLAAEGKSNMEIASKVIKAAGIRSR